MRLRSDLNPPLSLAGQLKLWNLKTGICIRTMDCGYAICSVFLPGDRHVSRPRLVPIHLPSH